MPIYCRSCSIEVLKAWKGWPQKDRLPSLPILGSDGCRKCGDRNAQALPGHEITWVNYHGPSNTGLPDYWLLEVGSSRWGLPYRAEGNCPQCGRLTVVSQMAHSDGSEDLKHNCETCGVVPVSPLRQLSPTETEEIERNLFWKVRPMVRDRFGFPWHRDAKKTPTTSRVESSQALAIDFFGTIAALGSKNAIFESWISTLGLYAKGPWEIELEALVPRDLLGEPRPTQLDALALGQGGIVIFECKFTEPDGGGCSQTIPIRSGAHKDLQQCTGNYANQTNPINGRSGRCALTAKEIKYWDYVSSIMKVDPAVDHYPCPFNGGWYQWMRNLVAAAAMGKRDEVPAAFVIVYADGPFSMARKVRSPEWQKLTACVEGGAVPLRTISYQDLLKLALAASTLDDRSLLIDLEKWMDGKYARVKASTRI